MKKRYLLLLCPFIFLTGCSTTVEQCDPANEDISFFHKMGCHNSGNYQARVDRKVQILENEKRANRQFRQIYAIIEKQKNDTSLTIKQRRSLQQKLETEVSQLTDEVKQKAKGRDDLQAQVNDIEQQLIKKVNSSYGSELEKQIELEKLHKKLQQLQKALNI